MLRLAIVGAGIMGANHGRVAMGLRDAEVSVIVDPDPIRGAALAEATGANYEPTLDGAAGRYDAAVLALPTALHAEVGIRLLEAGVPTLVEKPLAATVEKARALVDAAQAGDTMLMVGHVERFNPAVLELDNIVEDVIHIDARRISPYSNRIREGVILDLMIHDLDIVSSLVQSPVCSVQAVARATRSETEDLASALLLFANGATATITASRIGQNKIRELTVTSAESSVSVDLVRQNVAVNTMRHDEFVLASGASYRQSGMIQIPFLEHHGEPLYLELKHFVECVLKGEEPRVTGRQGLLAIELALRIRSAATCYERGV